MLKQENTRFFVLFAVFIGCYHQGSVVSIKAQELFSENSLCPWNEEGCAENNEKDDFSQEFDDNEDVFDGPENAISDLLESEDLADTESASNSWQGQLQAFDGILEDRNSAGSYIIPRDANDQGACSSPLGMESGTIKDAQITASSRSQPESGARLHLKRKYPFVTGGWQAGKNDLNQWIQDDLLAKTKITRVATQGRESVDKWVTKYKLQYGDDGVNFRYYKVPGQSSAKEFDGNRDRNTVVYNYLIPPIIARYIRLRPTVWHSSISLRMEFYGCSGVCPDNWNHLHGSCYQFFSNKVHWNVAKSACEALGSKLVVINSQAEQQELTARLPHQRSWIGLYRDPKNKNRWLWVDGSPVTYTSWQSGEPNNINEECAEKLTKEHGGGWNDAPCTTPYSYICETKADWCRKLSVKSGVSVSPSDCLSSNQKYGSTCSFSCAHGHQLSGPSSTQCGEAGVWSEQVSKVFCILVSKCPVLTVSRLVKTFPENCVTSQQNINTTCSFSCPHGYQLQGPSYKRCGANGQWTDSAKSVSCTDIDECAVLNGGCSHKCVNTAGGYKCECPDPELSLSLDNRTCHAAGVDVHCNRDNMTIIIPKSLLRGIDREHLRLLDTTCKAEETSAHFSLTTPLTGCNTTRRHTPTAIVYSNSVLEIPVAAGDVVTRVREIEIQFSCFYSKYGVVSSVGWKPSNRKLVFSDEGKGNFTLSLNMFPDKRYVSPYMKDDFPVAVVLRKVLFFEVSVKSGDKQLSIKADRCYATPTQDRQNSLNYEFITRGCPKDVTVKYHSAPSVSSQRFSVEAFKFIADHPFVFVHCHVIVCNPNDPDSQCAKKCPSIGRERRKVSDHVGEHVNVPYYLSQGPLHLAQEKREEKHGNVLDKGVSSPTSPMMALFVICVACLAGTGLIVFKKSRDRPTAVYELLVSGNQG